jgi:hypothetical protein
VLSFWQHNKVYAAASSIDLNTSFYGNIQWGFSEAELKLIDTDATYGPIENEDILIASGQSDAIAAKYGQCTGSGSASIGTIKTNGDVIQDASTGDVSADQGLCSPDNLSYDSPDPIAYDGAPGTSHHNDLVFRWRVEMMYNEDVKNMNAQAAGPVNT